ncbi:alpha/beta hydrolase, partial [Actinomadura fibrosa]
PPPRPEPVSRVQDLTIEGGDQQPLRLRLYVPAAASPLPVVVWLHGGSFVRGGLDTFDAARRSYANASGCLVVAVDQRLSPEARFPAPLLDAYAAVRWAARHARELGGDPHLIGIAGESSGGNLAAAATLLDRASETSVVSFQVLFTPLLDATISMPSATEYGRGHLLTREQLVWCYEQYAPGVPRHDPLLSPLHTPDVEGLPAAVIVTVENDPVRDEGEAYARRLAAAGVPVRHTRIEGMLHHFPGPQAIPLTARLTRDLLASGVAGALGADAGGRN